MPDLLLDDRDLTFAALIGAADNAATGLQYRRLGGVHRPSMHPFNPDCHQFAVIHNASSKVLIFAILIGKSLSINFQLDLKSHRHHFPPLFYDKRALSVAYLFIQIVPELIDETILEIINIAAWPAWLVVMIKI